MAQDSASTAVTETAATRKAATAYDDDIYSWAEEQVALLKAGRLSEIDARNIAEELSDVSKSEYRYLESALTVLIQHLLKWDHQPERRSRSWVLTVREQRQRIEQVLAESPGLKARLPGAVDAGFRYGRIRALEMQAEDEALPEACPYDVTALLERQIALPAKPEG